MNKEERLFCLEKVIEMLPAGVVTAQRKLTGGRSCTFDDFKGCSEAVSRVLQQAAEAAASFAPVWIFGEPGTGKEMLAQAIHNASAAGSKLFVIVDCADLSEKLLEKLLLGDPAPDAAGLLGQLPGGALYLKGAEHISLPLQSRLLRVLQEKKRRSPREGPRDEPRVITASCADPAISLEKGALRRDLYFKLAAHLIFIPPLRERREDICLLGEYFLQKSSRNCGRAKKLSLRLKKLLESYSWPGNVRELAHVIEMLAHYTEGAELLPDQLPPYLREKSCQRSLPEQPAAAVRRSEKRSLAESLLETERQIILDGLKRNRGNVSQTAVQLGLARQNLQYRMRKLSVNPRDYL